LDNLTHSLFGLTLARTPLGRTGRGVTAALLLGSNAPDIDIVTTAGGAATYLEWHRGPTHGPIGVVALGLACAALVAAALRLTRRGEGSRDRESGRNRAQHHDEHAPAPFRMLALAAAIGVSCHVLMDLPTSYGTRLLSPFSWTWFATDWLPIVDVYLLAILGVGLWFGRSAPVRNAVVAIVLMLGYYGFRGGLHARAIAVAPAVFGAQMPERCTGGPASKGAIDSWPNKTGDELRAMAGRRCVVEIAAMPDFISPFHWRLIAQLSGSYEVRTIDLLDRRPWRTSDARILAVRYPNQWTPAAAKASTAPKAKTFLGFSRFPSVRSFIDADGTSTVIWTDLRFVAVDGSIESRRPPPSLFGARVRVSADGRVLSEGLSPPD
jgi:membrane-bound metal-dependent hydrolase YbcI (DUF457 family)